MYLFGIEVIPATDSEIKQQRENVYTKPGPRNTVATDKPIGRTLVVNPGSEYGEGVLRGCLITIADGQIKSYQMTAG
jgi:hypothetical protein